MADMLPAIFFGHGNPMNAVAHNDYTETWRRMGAEIPKPAAILSISAHWLSALVCARDGRHRLDSAAYHS
jgi:aromatic ring-opening dioxygenase catalytic subunit (LigB family)